jgi:hypothetical protein
MTIVNAPSKSVVLSVEHAYASRVEVLAADCLSEPVVVIPLRELIFDQSDGEYTDRTSFHCSNGQGLIILFRDENNQHSEIKLSSLRRMLEGLFNERRRNEL